MKKLWILVIAGTLLSMQPAFCQLGGGLGGGGIEQQTRRAMEMAMIDLEMSSLGVTRETLEESYGEEELEAFLDTAVVRLSVDPAGMLLAEYMQGGEVLDIKFGSKRARTGEETGDWASDWIQLEGEFSPGKRPQKVSMRMRAGQQEVNLDCLPKYKKADGAVTYYVGLLDGLMCIGLIDEDEDVEG